MSALRLALLSVELGLALRPPARTRWLLASVRAHATSKRGPFEPDLDRDGIAALKRKAETLQPEGAADATCRRPFLPPPLRPSIPLCRAFPLALPWRL